ncbi:efflux RND transporter periplasmic adaptor subunit [Paenochrobactrum sp. BZR 588]|uniref:efflux RND transporter periplasmic adaptor subunit n=1 Tax=Paenochrobactrum TaxID=999488 RepID=UPI0035BC5B7D
MNDQPVIAPSPALKTAQNKHRKSRKPAYLKWLLIAVIVAGGAFWYWQSSGADQGTGTAQLTQKVVRGDIENAITAVGTLKALRSVNVGAQVSGQLKSVKVEVGDQVTKSQLLAEIDPAPIEKRVEMSSAQLENLEAQLISREAQAKIKKLNADRQRALLATRGVSKATVEQADADQVMAEADVKSLRAQIRQQQAQVESEKVDLGYTKIYSPMDGTIVDQPAKEGETLNAVQSAPTVVTVADLTILSVEAQVSEADISRLKIGMEAYFTLLGQPGKRYQGKLRQIKPTPEVLNNVVLYYALFDVPNPDDELKIDMSAQVYFINDAAKDALLVPVSALKDAPSGNGKTGSSSATVSVVTPSGATQEKTVEVGIRNRVQAQVISGLEEGETVIINNAASGQSGNRRNNFRPGMF